MSVPQVHGSVGEPWWLWVEDPINDHIYHSEYFLLQKKQVGIHNVIYIYILLFTHLADAFIQSILNLNLSAEPLLPSFKAHLDSVDLYLLQTAAVIIKTVPRLSQDS